MARPKSPTDEADSLIKHFPDTNSGMQQTKGSSNNNNQHTLAYRFNPNGEGLCYYPNGRVALAVSKVSDHQFKFYVYDNNPDKTMLCSLNEYAVGFALNNTRSHEQRHSRLVLTAKGGIWADQHRNVKHEWKWDRKAQNKGVLPAEGIHMPLNKNLTLSFTDRFNIDLKYDVDGIVKHFSAGMKLKRMSSYLDTARPTGLGKLDVSTHNRRSLNQRQMDFGNSMGALRNKNNPKSQNLSTMVSGIVSGLEDHFDTYEKDKRGSKCLKLEMARTDGFNSTAKELPRIRKTDQDIEFKKGHSDSLYIDKGVEYDFDAKKTARKILLKPNGKWRTDLEIRQQLQNHEHPQNPRPRFLQCASGHYSYRQPLATGELRENNIEKISTVPEIPELEKTLKSRVTDMEDFMQALLNKKYLASERASCSNTRRGNHQAFSNFTLLR